MPIPWFAITMNGIIGLVSVVIPARNPTLALAELIERLATQLLPACTSLEIIVVDDGSTVPMKAPTLATQPRVPVRVIRRNPGGNRSAARNVGAKEGNGDILIFLDADCRPATPNFIAKLCRALASESVSAAGGPIRGTGQGFWCRYQSDLQAARQRLDTSAAPPLTAANLAVKRSAFLNAGGFDEGYVGYGFEDRDLILRLALEGEVKWVPGALVAHEDSLCLFNVAQKLCEAGRLTSERFRDRHPAVYRSLGYAAVDAGLHPWLATVAPPLGYLALSSAPHIDRLLAGDRLPYLIGKLLVKAISAASFLYGTSLRSSSA